MTMSAWKINALPGRITAWFLSWFLFASGITLYIYTAHKRHIENPDDKVVPTIAQLTDGFLNASLKPAEEDDGTGAGTNAGLWQRVRHSMLWHDTGASARRFHISLAILFPAAVLGLHIGVFPYIGAFFLRFILFFDKIIALSVLPILFIAFGIDELSKIMLMAIGVTPTIILDSFNLSRGVPKEQIVKGFTLGAGNFDIAYPVVLKQVFPRVLNSIRINLKWVCLL